MLESEYQLGLIKRIEARLPGCIVLKNDPAHKPGFPDLTILYLNHWATLEVKTHRNAATQPNQPYYVQVCHAMSFSSFIYPENEEEVLDALQQTFSARRTSLVL